MVDRIEVVAITLAAEERERLKHIAEEEAIKEKTCVYCSAVISEMLKEEANKPAHSMMIITSRPDNDGDVHMVTKMDDSPYYIERTGLGYYNLETLVKFISEHGFDVDVADGFYRYNRNTSHPCKKITIQW